MKDTPAPIDVEARWQRWAAQTRAWGPPGNERLTTSAGLVLLVLLGIETLTTLALSSYLPEHIFLGLLLIPPVALKLTSTGWRFVRYYTNNRPYRLAGPPRLPLRLIAPVLVVSTLTLFGSGVALIIHGHGGGPLLQLHVVSFAVWGVLVAIHILAYLTRALREGPADWRRHADRVAGDGGRRAARRRPRRRDPGAGDLFGPGLLARPPPRAPARRRRGTRCVGPSANRGEVRRAVRAVTADRRGVRRPALPRRPGRAS